MKNPTTKRLRQEATNSTTQANAYQIMMDFAYRRAIKAYQAGNRVASDTYFQEYNRLNELVEEFKDDARDRRARADRIGL